VNPEYKPAPGNPSEAHPGAVYGLRFSSDGKQLVSVGQAPKGSGHVSLWNVTDGKLLATRSLPLGPFYSLALAPDGKTLAVASGPKPRGGIGGIQDGNPAYILKLPTGQ
jgi:WD40 repeat protein